VLVKRKLISLFVVLLVGIITYHVFSTMKRVAEAYLYAYPLVLMEQTRLAFVDQAKSDERPWVGEFRHIQYFPDHSFRDVVRPNNDTLYSVAWLDLRNEPVILSVPDTQGRYYVMPFMDAWTNVFAMVGKRTSGTNAGEYAIVGPNWSGHLPQGVTAFESPTTSVWLIGRIQANGVDDVPQVAELQAKFSLTPMSRWSRKGNTSSDKRRAENTWIVNTPSNKHSSPGPMEVVEAVSANVFFARFAHLVAEQGALELDREALLNMERLGLLNDSSQLDGRFKKLGAIDSLIYDMAIKLTQRKLADSIRTPRSLENGWSVHRSIIGNYGSNYAFRAAVAKIGLGALPVSEAAYPNTKLDINGDYLDGRLLGGRKSYRLHFDAGQLPPVDAFWSLSLYNEQGYFVESPINRYSIGDRDALHYNADGSLDILIQASKPDDVRNWLPAPKAKFALTMRLYSPKKRFLDKVWSLPPVEALN